MADAPQMVFLGFGKYVRADRIYAVEPLADDERGSGCAHARLGRGHPRAADRVPHRAGDPGRDGRRPGPAASCAAGREPLLGAPMFAAAVPAPARRHATVPPPRLPEPVARPGGLDDRRRDRRRRRPVPGLHAHPFDRARRAARPRLADPAARRAADRRGDRRRARPPHGAAAHRDRHGGRRSALPRQLAAGASAGLGALRAAGPGRRDLQPRPAGVELAGAEARAGRRDRRRRRRSPASTTRSRQSAGRQSAAS